MNTDVFSMNRYLARRKVFKLLGGAFTIHEPDRLDVVAYVRQKAFKLKEDITVFTDDSMREELLFIRDQWEILDANEEVLGRILEDSTVMALLRRFASNLIPQRFRIEADGHEVGSIRQYFNPFVLKYDVDFSMDTSGVLDRRIGLALAVLLLAIEGRQS